MSKKLPTISVTAEHHSSESSSSSASDSYSNDMDYGNNDGDGITDVEDLDSQAEANKSHSRRNFHLKEPKADFENDVTDVEDYNTESEDDEKSCVYPELKLSLCEFLQQGLQNQQSINSDVKESYEVKAGNFLQAQNLNGTADYLTDCEDYDTDSELKYDCFEKSVCVDLDKAIGEQGRMSIADVTKPHNDDDSDEYEDVSVISDISDLASALSDVTGIGARGMSEDEVFEVSGDEEVCQIACSDTDSDSAAEANKTDSYSASSVAPIDVAFICASGGHKANAPVASSSSTTSFMTTKRQNLLQVATHIDEVLTDVEGLDDSTAEDGVDSFDNEEDNDQPIPRAIIMATGDDTTCLTDVEDMLYDDDNSIASTMPDIKSIGTDALPAPHREVVELKEDTFGDTITNVMPMDTEYQFGIYNQLYDDIRTDTEDYSCANSFDGNVSIAEDLQNAHTLMENEVIIANEVMKPQQNKRLELQTNAEPVTDIEEIYVDGTNRRKKFKNRSLSKGSKSKLLEVIKINDDGGGGTDIEDIDLSDCGLPAQMKQSKQNKAERTTNDKVTDIEDITADEISDSVSDCAEVANIDLKLYTANNDNIVFTLEKDAATKLCNNTKLKPLHRQLLRDDAAISQQNTDIEDCTLPSDAEDVCCDDEDGVGDVVADSCTCNELNDMLNESYTVVHEKSGSSFDVDAEKLHLKGMPRDAHTDIEYVESDESAAARGGN